MTAYEQRQAFLNLVEAQLESNPELFVDVIERMNRGVQNRINKINVLRVDAESALVLAYDLIAESKLKRNPTAATRIKKVLVSSGLISGSNMAKQLQAELQLEE